MEKKASTRLRELLNRRELLVMSGGFSPLHARMSEMLGYEAFFMSGSQVAAFVYGYPTLGCSDCMRWWRASGASPTSPTFRSLPTPTPVTATRLMFITRCRPISEPAPQGYISKTRSTEKVRYAGGAAAHLRRGSDRQVQSRGCGEERAGPGLRCLCTL